MFLVVAGAVSATDISNASNKEDSNLTNDNVNALSQEKLEVSNEDSISQTNMVNSHDDNLNDYLNEDVLASSYGSYYGDNTDQKLGIANSSNIMSISNEDVLNRDVGNTAKVASGNIKTSLSVYNTHYDSSSTKFRVSLQDNNGNALTNQKISMKIDGKTYTGLTNTKGDTYIKTAALAVGTYNVAISYSGNSEYSSSSLSKKVKVSSSISGKDLTKYYSADNYYSATFWKDSAYLANTKVTFNIDGKKYTFKTNKNGVAVAKAYLKPGNHTVSVTNPVTKEKITNKIVVKKDTSKLTGVSKVYLLPNYSYSYSATLKSSHGSPIKNAEVTFKVANTTLSAKTDENGKASVVIPILENGVYNISYKFQGNEFYYSSSSLGSICVKKAANKLIASDLKMKYKDGSKFTVKLTDNYGKILSGKTIKFYLNNKEYSGKTNSKGIASLSVGDLKPGTYKIKYSYSSRGLSDYNLGFKNIVISKLTIKLNAWNLVMKHKDGSVYKAYVKDQSGKNFKNILVKFAVNGKNYYIKTDSKGIAMLKVDLPVGYYTIKSSISHSFYTANPVSKHILVNGTKFSASQLYVISGYTTSYSVKLIDGKSNPVKNAAIKFTIDDKNYTKRTNSTGDAKVYLGLLKGGDHAIKFAYGSTKASSTIHVVTKVTLKNLISASKNVKNYVVNNEKLPSTVKIGSLTFTTAEYLYLASKAIVNLKSNNKADITIKKVKNPSSPGAAVSKGSLNDYVSVAKSLIKTVESKGQMPNYVSSSLGSLGYNGVAYAFARVISSYGDTGVLPSSVSINSLSNYYSTSKLNSKNTISNLAPYLAASTNCQVNNTKIKQVVDRLTSGLTSDKDKAVAIFNYVRDTISYSFYYDTRYGAVGTLNSKAGNCVDHSHLLVAMYRTAGLAARYAHGTCSFNSGTYGHVWTQVLIGDTWVVSDATSPRNSFGNVVNWNSNSYSLHGYFSSIAF